MNNFEEVLNNALENGYPIRTKTITEKRTDFKCGKCSSFSHDDIVLLIGNTSFNLATREIY